MLIHNHACLSNQVEYGVHLRVRHTRPGKSEVSDDVVMSSYFPYDPVGHR